MVDRNQVAREKLKEKGFNERYKDKLRQAKLKVDYITNLIKARYFTERCNMMAEQLNSKMIMENVDGCIKSESYLRSEYALTKVQAINTFRQSHFMKLDLMKDFGMSEEEVKDLETDYYDGKIIRESYDDEYRKKDKAQFVKEFKKEQAELNEESGSKTN